MILELKYEHTNFLEDILPYIKNGIFIDTSVMKIFLDGFIKLKFSKIVDDEYNNLISIFEYLNVSNKWDSFLITPHLFTEICQHFCQDDNRNKRTDFNKIVEEVIPILKKLKEEEKVTKNKILDLIDKNKPVIEIGDLSIFVSVDNLLNMNKKIAIIEKDKNIRERFENYPNILIIDFDKTILDLKQI